ncbi:MAG: hypothetical protein WD398_15475 [Cyclobacteriaceae bacterium]
MQTKTEKKPDNQAWLLANSEKRTRCLVYTRVKGYHRQVESFNIGKKGEHRQRNHFTESTNVPG